MPDKPVPFTVAEEGDQLVLHVTDPEVGKTYHVRYLNGTWTVATADGDRSGTIPT